MFKAQINIRELQDYSSKEALNTLCSNLLFTGKENKKLLITSCSPHDGKSVLSMQILCNLAKRDMRVVLVDADMRRSNLIRNYRISLGGQRAGLAHCLAGICSLDEVIYETNIHGAYIIPSGTLVANPLQLLSNVRFSLMLDKLAENFDLIIIDSPPVGAVVDSAVMAKSCDGAVFVTSYNETGGRELLDAKRQMQMAGCKVLGCILNKVNFESIAAKKYYSKSYYQKYTSDYYSVDSGSGHSSVHR